VPEPGVSRALAAPRTVLAALAVLRGAVLGRRQP